MLNKNKILSIIMMGLFLNNCSATDAAITIKPDPEPTLSEAPEIHALTRYENCDDLLAGLKEQAIAEIESTLDSYATCWSYEDCGTTSDDMTTMASPTSTDGSEAAEYTATNLQESNVDEADIIKTDGEYIYVATSAGVDVFKAWPLSEFEKIATYAFDNSVDTLYLNKSVLIAIGEAYDSNYNYKINITFLDVSNPTNPQTIKTKMVEGELISSRLAGGVLHVATSNSLDYEIDYPEQDWDLLEIACGEGSAADQAMQELLTQIETAKAEFKAEIENATIADFLPSYGDEETESTASCTNLMHDNSNSDYISGLASFSVSDDTQEFMLIHGRAQEVYASTESVYFAAKRSDEDASDIHRFTIGGENVLHAYHASGAISGHVLDQFSISEHEKYLRVATTVGQLSRSGSSEVYNNVFILDSDSLAITGAVERIAEGEAIYAARFIGNKGYVVTFEKVDPLFVLDLSDPSNPTIEGELKIPGYSTYLHPLDDNHLIGLGKDAEDAGDFSWYQGLKLAVFDVTDTTSPTSLDDLIIGSRGSESEALTNHHAFTFDNESGILALPITLYEGGNGGSDSGDYQYDGVHLYSVSAENGIETLAEIEVSDDWNSVERTLILGDDNERGLFVLDGESLSIFELRGHYDLLGTESL